MGPKGTVLGGTLLIAGTTIGGGMLALPVLTSVAGFWPSIVLYFFCWVLMACTGLLFLELSQWFPYGANIISMAQTTLGKPGKLFAWAVYLFLFYSLCVAYIVGCGNILSSVFSIPDWAGPLLFVLLFGPLLSLSNSIVGKLNIYLILGLAFSYLAFVALGLRYVNLSFLSKMDWSQSMRVLPIAFTSFAYQGTVPTLINYLHHDVPRVRKSILIGSFIPFIAYFIWQVLIMGIVPIEGSGGLLDALSKGQNAIQPLANFIHNPVVFQIGQFFAFFALATSFLGVTLGLRDFLADGLKIKETRKRNPLFSFGVLVIPLAIAFFYPHIFLTALDYAGGFGTALLLGLLPIVMVWIKRNQDPVKHAPQVSGGNVVLGVLGTFVVIEVVSEILHLYQV